MELDFILIETIINMNENPTELHYKMCKKVAQLTKVIFLLNTKNGEYESNLRAVVNAYET